jgi:hypothetical protein
MPPIPAVSSNSGNVVSRTGGSNDGTFSITSSPDTSGGSSAQPGTTFSNIATDFIEGASQIGQAFLASEAQQEIAENAPRQTTPVFTRSLFRGQTTDQLRQPTFDQRFAQPRIGTVQTTQTAPAGASRTLIPGVPNGALVFGAAAVIGLLMIARG